MSEMTTHVARLEAKDTPEGSQCHLHIYYNISELDESGRLLMLQFVTKAIGEFFAGVRAMPESERRLQLSRAKGQFVHLKPPEPKPENAG